MPNPCPACDLIKRHRKDCPKRYRTVVFRGGLPVEPSPGTMPAGTPVDEEIKASSESQAVTVIGGTVTFTMNHKGRSLTTRAYDVKELPASPTFDVRELPDGSMEAFHG